MKKFFALADTHSFYDEAMKALAECGFESDNQQHIVILCGDAFDRGPKTRALFEWLVDLQSKHRLIYIRGNHEDLFEDAAKQLTTSAFADQHHLSNGTLDSISNLMNCSIYDLLCHVYRNEDLDSTLGKARDFINSSVDSFRLGETLFVHGWLPTTVENGVMTVSKDWELGNWYAARWKNGIDYFRANLIPPDVTTVVCGHWHSSYAWAHIKHLGTEFDDDAIFEPFIYFDDSKRKQLVALDCCTAYSKKCGCVVFSENGLIIGSNQSKLEGYSERY